MAWEPVIPEPPASAPSCRVGPFPGRRALPSSPVFRRRPSPGLRGDHVRRGHNRGSQSKRISQGVSILHGVAMCNAWGHGPQMRPLSQWVVLAGTRHLPICRRFVPTGFAAVGCVGCSGPLRAPWWCLFPLLAGPVVIPGAASAPFLVVSPLSSIFTIFRGLLGLRVVGPFFSPEIPLSHAVQKVKTALPRYAVRISYRDPFLPSSRPVDVPPPLLSAPSIFFL